MLSVEQVIFDKVLDVYIALFGIIDCLHLYGKNGILTKVGIFLGIGCILTESYIESVDELIWVIARRDKCKRGHLLQIRVEGSTLLLLHVIYIKIECRLKD